MTYLGVEYGTKYELQRNNDYTGLTNTNLVPNASLESGVATGWHDGGGGVTVNTLAASSTWSAVDSFGLHYKVTNNEGTSKIAQLLTASGTGGIPVTANTNYVVKMMVHPITLPTGNVEFGAVFWTSGGAFASEPVTKLIGTGDQEIELVVNSGATGAFAAVEILHRAVPAGQILDVWLDAIQFEKASVAAPVFAPTRDQVANGDIIWAGSEFASAATYRQHTRAVFNEPNDPDYVGMLSVESSGLDAPEIREDSAERVEDDGAIFGDFFAGKRPVVLQGYIAANSIVQRNERVGKLKRASNAKIDNSTLTFEPVGAGQPVRVELRRQQPIRVSSKGPLKEFQLSMISADSRIVSSILHSGSGVGIKFNASTEAFPNVNPTGSAYTNAIGKVGSAWTTPANAKANDAVFTTTETPQYTIGVGGNTTQKLITAHTIPGAAGGRYFTLSIFYKGKVSVESPVSFSYVIIANGIRSQVIHSAFGMNTSNLVFFSTPDLMSMFTGKTELGRKELSEALKTSCTAEFWFEGFSGAKAGTLSIDSVGILAPFLTPATASVVNNGDTPSSSILKVTGPVTNPTIENETNGEKMIYHAAIQKGEVVTFNTSARTAFSSLFGNVYNNISAPTNWISIKPGTNNIALFGESGSESESKIEVEWRDAWE